MTIAFFICPFFFDTLRMRWARCHPHLPSLRSSFHDSGWRGRRRRSPATRSQPTRSLFFLPPNARLELNADHQHRLKAMSFSSSTGPIALPIHSEQEEQRRRQKRRTGTLNSIFFAAIFLIQAPLFYGWGRHRVDRNTVGMKGFRLPTNVKVSLWWYTTTRPAAS